MATLSLTTKEFADVAMIWLFDQVMNPEQITNETLAEFVREHKGKLKTPLMAYYFDTDSQRRFDYRRISGIFDGSDKSTQQIKINPDTESKEKEKKKEGLVKKIIKKVLAKEELTLEDMIMLKEVQDADDEVLVEGKD